MVSSSMTALAYDRVGSGPPLVLLHPLGADRRVWQPVLGRLSAQRDCIAVDLPGFGESPALAGPAHPGDLARVVGVLLRDLGVAPGGAHLAGNSLGGWVAFESALLGDAASVTAIAPAGLWTRPLAPKPEVARSVARAARPLLPLVLRVPAGRRAILSGTVARPDQVPRTAALRLVRAYADAPGFTAANRAMRSAVFAGLAEIEVPVTLVWPEFDRIVTRPRSLPANVTNLDLPGCGHVPMWDDPEAVATALLAGSSSFVSSSA
jgi:pimeloyl-ACP methyl ester carboxylesterase